MGGVPDVRHEGCRTRILWSRLEEKESRTETVGGAPGTPRFPPRPRRPKGEMQSVQLWRGEPSGSPCTRSELAGFRKAASQASRIKLKNQIESWLTTREKGPGLGEYPECYSGLGVGSCRFSRRVFVFAGETRQTCAPQVTAGDRCGPLGYRRVRCWRSRVLAATKREAEV